MQIELRLKKVLAEYKLDYHGSKKELADACGVHRHTIGKLLNNEMCNPSLDVLSDICRWILDKRPEIDPQILPGALFGSRPPKLWQAFGRAGSVTIFLGEYRRTHKPAPKQPETEDDKPNVPSVNIPAHRSVSRRDAEVDSMIIRKLSSHRTMGPNRPEVYSRYLPFQYLLENPYLTGCEIEADRKRAISVFNNEIRGPGAKGSVILLGSQRVNYLLECLVADLYGCKPFQPVNGTPCVPFYLSYRDFDRSVQSCFGGRDFPPEFSSRNQAEYMKFQKEVGKRKSGDEDTPPAIPGTYYLPDREGPWQICPWKSSHEDAGIVIVIRDGDRLEMAVFGFSGSSTVAVGRDLIKHPWKYWPKSIEFPSEENEKGERDADTLASPPTHPDEAGPEATVIQKGLEYGVFVCRVKFTPKEKPRKIEDDWDGETCDASIEDVIPLPLWS